MLLWSYCTTHPMPPENTTDEAKIEDDNEDACRMTLLLLLLLLFWGQHEHSCGRHKTANASIEDDKEGERGRGKRPCYCCYYSHYSWWRWWCCTILLLMLMLLLFILRCCYGDSNNRLPHHYCTDEYNAIRRIQRRQYNELLLFYCS